MTRIQWVAPVALLTAMTLPQVQAAQDGYTAPPEADADIWNIQVASAHRCALEQAAALDDRVSDARTVALAAMRMCIDEMHNVARSSAIGRPRGAEYAIAQSLERQMAPILTVHILQNRAKKQEGENERSW